MIHVLVFIVGLGLQIWPLGWLVGYFLKKWVPEIGDDVQASAVPKDGFRKASIYIGLLERMIIYTLVWVGAYEAISFILTGKALLRFREAQEEHKSTYVLVGTLLSSTLALLSGLAFHKLFAALAEVF